MRDGVECGRRWSVVSGRWAEGSRRRAEDRGWNVGIRSRASKEVLVSVVMDKRYLQDYMDSPKLHRKAWELLCKRIENFLREKHPKHKAILVTDDVSKQANLSVAVPCLRA